MSQTSSHYQIVTTQGDITTFQADAMGNAANALLVGGGGVDGAIHSAAGPQLLTELQKSYPQGVAPGEAVITPAYGKLKVKWVIHAVGPIWRGGSDQESETLYSAYLKCYQLAEMKQCRHLLMPAISCGIYGFPHPQAANIAIQASRSFLATSLHLKKVEFVLLHYQLLEVF
ncbi:MAG: hypothetical protein HN730_10010, partial [Bdellovibrionales bacterium]|nr:hypothetical protein [Bdellovibrionales bacterium]